MILKPNGGHEDERVPVNLVDGSLEDLVAALLRQQPIEVPDGSPFVLSSENARRILAHYAKNRHLWPRAKPVLRDEIEGVLQAMDVPLTAGTVASPQRTVGRRTWRLTRVEAHRFAGLHRHCGKDGADPAVFVLDLERDVTLIRGFNGAGKTALQNAIIWCLTGRALRSQHLPDQIHEPMEVSWAGGRSIADGGNEPAVDLPPAVPIPSAAELESLADKAKVDTWTQLTFRDPDTNEVRLVRRHLTLGRRGKIGMEADGLADLGLTDLAIEVGTLMPGIAAQMRFDERTTFAKAVATLTGLKPLEELGQRSQRVVNRLRGEEKKKTENDATAKVRDFNSRRMTMRDAWTGQPDLGKPVGLLGEDDKRPAEWSSLLADARKQLESMKEASEKRVEAALGRGLETHTDADALLKQLHLVSESLGPRALNGLPTIAVIRELGAIDQSDAESAQALMREMVSRAEAVSKRYQRPDQAARWQLYARVSGWHHEHHAGASIDECPVCRTDLAVVAEDPVVGRGVRDALELARDVDNDVSKGVEEWEIDASRELLERLPKSLRGFVDRELPDGLLAVYREAYVGELLADSSLAAPLHQLKASAEKVWNLSVASHPLKDGPATNWMAWPPPFEASRLATSCHNVEQALRLARQRKDNVQAIRGLMERYVGKARPPDLDESPDGSGWTREWSDELPLRDQVEALRRCVSAASPILSLLRQLDELESTSKAHAGILDRATRIADAADAVAEFTRFPDLVFQQVTGLIATLDAGTKAWLERIYRPHYRGGPAYSGFDATQEKGLGLRAGVSELQVEAHRIMNASQLRACVWAFVFSLWERVRARTGGSIACSWTTPRINSTRSTPRTWRQLLPRCQVSECALLLRRTTIGSWTR